MSHAQPAHLPIPSRVGNYQLLKTIGKGQFGYVKLAIHDLTRERVRGLTKKRAFCWPSFGLQSSRDVRASAKARPLEAFIVQFHTNTSSMCCTRSAQIAQNKQVAIKVIQKNRLDEKTLKMVSREISIMKLLNHPNVIRLYEVIDSEIFLFLVMEYAAGGEVRLRSFRSKALPHCTLLRIITMSPSSELVHHWKSRFLNRHDPLLTYKDLTLTNSPLLSIPNLTDHGLYRHPRQVEGERR